MVRITHHGYKGLCEVCQRNVPLGSTGKRNHYRSEHSEIQFKCLRTPIGKTVYGCGMCDKVSAMSNYASLVSHYKEWHPEVLPGPILLQPAKQESKLETSNPGNPMERVDNFFEGLGAVMAEVETLRRERKEWMDRAIKWANKIAELQELMGRKQ